MSQVKSWFRAWRGFFEHIAQPLAGVLGAQGCREGWVQAEAFRYFRERGVALYTNYLVLPGVAGLKNRKADFAAYSSHDDAAALRFIGELKVYGEVGFANKNLTGGGLREVERRVTRDESATFNNTKRDRQLVVGPGLIADYFRLVDFDAGIDCPARMLILCVQRASKPDRLGKLLSAVSFEKEGTMLLETKDAYVKAWLVGAGR